jgi:YfiH family protein
VTTAAKRAAPGRIPPQNKLQLLQSQSLKKTSWLVHGFSTRPGGVSDCYGDRSLNLGFTQEDTVSRVEENRRLFLRALRAATRGRLWPIIVNRQIHSDVIHVVRDVPSHPLVGDGLVTGTPGLVIAIMTADCIPVLLVDTRKKVIGAFHAGWRGTLKRIVEKGAGVMRSEFGSRPQDIHALIGPGIGKCCYEIGDEVKNEFESQFSYTGALFHEVHESDPVRKRYPLLFLEGRAPGHGDRCRKLYLDLAMANRQQLQDAGVPKKQIATLKECPACDTRMFFSHRAEKGRTGRMMAGIGMVPRPA